MTTSQPPAPDVHEQLASLRDQVLDLDRQRTELEYARAVQAGAGRVLEQVATGAPLGDVLHKLIEDLYSV